MKGIFLDRSHSSNSRPQLSSAALLLRTSTSVIMSSEIGRLGMRQDTVLCTYSSTKGLSIIYKMCMKCQAKSSTRALHIIIPSLVAL